MYHEKRTLFVFNVYYYWFDEDAFKESTKIFSILKTHRLIPSKDYSFKIDHKSFITDLSKTEDELILLIKSRTRNIIRNKAKELKLVVEKATEKEEKEQFYLFFQHFVDTEGRRKKVLPLLKDELDRLDIFYITEANGEYLGGVAFLGSKDKSTYYYKYGATSHKHYASDILFWEALKYAKNNNYKYFDSSDVIITEDKNHPFYGYYQFKKKWGGELSDFYIYYKIGFPYSFLTPFLKILFNDKTLQKINEYSKKLRLFK